MEQSIGGRQDARLSNSIPTPMQRPFPPPPPASWGAKRKQMEVEDPEDTKLRQEFQKVTKSRHRWSQHGEDLQRLVRHGLQKRTGDDDLDVRGPGEDITCVPDGVGAVAPSLVVTSVSETTKQ